MSFYWFDVAGAAIILAFAAFSWFKGFIREVFSAIGWFGGYLGATAFYPPVSLFYQKYMGHPVLADILAFFSVFVGIFILVKLISWIMREKLGLNSVPSYINGPAGGLMGAVKGALFISVLLIPLNYFPNMKKEFLEKSYVAQLVSGVSELCYPLFRFDVAKTEQIIKEDMDKLKPPPADVTKPVAKTTARPTSMQKEEKPAAPAKTAHQPPIIKNEEKTAAVAEKSKPAPPPPVLKKTEPVKKQKQAGDADDGEMDQFVRSLH
jgi:uncharacterized membrane protein required for colicin V production